MEIPPLYTFKENCEEAPPTYDDYEKESWTTGPVEFIAPTSLKALVILYITVKCIASIGLTVVWMCLNQDQDQNGAVGIGVFYGCFGIWPWPLMTFYSRRHMTLARYKFSRFWYSWWTLLFIAETTFFLVLGPIGLILKYRVWIPFGGGIALAIANVLMFWICTHYECFNHEPLRRGAKHVLTDVCHAENTPFRFVATTAFRIVIKNVSNETVSGNFTVYRKTGEINRKSFILWIRAQFTLKLVDFAPGEQITCIPESHTLEGATVIPDFRSFGVDRSHVVKTAIYKGSRRDACDLRAQPLFGKNDLVHASVTATKDTPFKIITSSACRIVFENTISGEFTVIREIGEKSYKGQLLFDQVQFPLTRTNVAPRQRITCIPETQRLPGAISIPDCRSFGRDRSSVVRLCTG